MPAPLNDFLALPKPHHHVSRLLVLVIILVVLGLLAWLFTVLWGRSGTIQIQPTSTNVAGQSGAGISLSDNDIERIMNSSPASGTKATSLTQQQIYKITTKPVPPTTKSVSLTPEQIQNIINQQ